MDTRGATGVGRQQRGSVNGGNGGGQNLPGNRGGAERPTDCFGPSGHPKTPGPGGWGKREARKKKLRPHVLLGGACRSGTGKGSSKGGASRSQSGQGSSKSAGARFHRQGGHPTFGGGARGYIGPRGGDPWGSGILPFGQYGPCTGKIFFHQADLGGPHTNTQTQGPGGFCWGGLKRGGLTFGERRVADGATNPKAASVWGINLGGRLWTVTTGTPATGPTRRGGRDGFRSRGRRGKKKGSGRPREGDTQ